MLQKSKKTEKKGMNLSSGYLQKGKGQNMLNKNRRNTIKANAPIVKLMNLVWGL